MTDKIAKAEAAPETIYAGLSGSIDQILVQRAIHGVAGAMHAGAKTMHVMFQSTGGNVGDGIALYNFFRGLPIDLHLYNAGALSSVAVIAYLGAKHRYVSANASFLIHRAYITTSQFSSSIAGHSERLRVLADMLQSDDSRIFAILRTHLAADLATLTHHRDNETPIDAKTAGQWGLATKIADFVVPAGNEFFAV